MKKIGIWNALLIVALVFSGFSCSEDEEEDAIGNWTKTTPFFGNPRSGAITFTIGNKAFVGLGYDGDDYLSDFYVFDITEGFWDERAPFPGTLRERAVAFSVNGKGYVGLGRNVDLDDDEELRDFWEYDPDADTWTPIGEFEGTARFDAISFTLGSKAYVGTGYDGDKYNSDFWEFNPTPASEEDRWIEVKSYPGEKIRGGLAFVVNDKAYICGGLNNGLYNNDFWEFSVGSEVTWTRRTPSDEEAYYDDFTTAVRRHDAMAVTIGDRAFIIGGMVSSSTVKSVYEFNATTFEWQDKTEFEGSARSLAVAYTLNGRAFVGTGQNGSSRYDDVWEFKPDEEYDADY
jgi:N-acetylneuraminic acid mutarotase